MVRVASISGQVVRALLLAALDRLFSQLRETLLCGLIELIIVIAVENVSHHESRLLMRSLVAFVAAVSVAALILRVVSIGVGCRRCRIRRHAAVCGEASTAAGLARANQRALLR